VETQTLSPKTIEEHIVWHSIRATYLFFAAGALYVLAPVLGWCLLLLLLYRLWHNGYSHSTLPDGRIPTALWFWIIGMSVMLLALVVGHLDFDLGTGKLIKSSIGWAKGWALLAIFPLLGCLNIRPQIIHRASTRVCLHTLLLLPLFIGAWLLGLPQTLYVSPLQVIGGPVLNFSPSACMRSNRVATSHAGDCSPPGRLPWVLSPMCFTFLRCFCAAGTQYLLALDRYHRQRRNGVVISLPAGTADGMAVYLVHQSSTLPRHIFYGGWQLHPQRTHSDPVARYLRATLAGLSQRTRRFYPNGYFLCPFVK